MPVNVLLLGTLTSDAQNEKLLSFGVRPAPADIVQRYLIEGLCANERVESVNAITSPRISPCHKNKIKKVDSSSFEIKKCAVESVGFLNFPAFAFYQREKRLVLAAKKWAKQNVGKETLVLIYSMHSPFLRAASKIKKILPNACIALVVPDLPQYMGHANRLKRILKNFDRKRIDRYMECVDKYVLYTKYMAEYFGLEEDQWCVLEGLIDTSKINLEEREAPKQRICLYAGSLLKQYALDQLIVAFEKADVDAELHLYGNPFDAEVLMQEHADCKKTKYMGVLPQQAVFEKMKEASLLVNPRPSTLELTKYSCPSKTFEYMASGTPVLMAKLPGIPEEYHPYLYFFEREDEEGFVEAFERLLHLDRQELVDKGKAAAEFLVANKGSEKQVAELLDFCLGRL